MTTRSNPFAFALPKVCLICGQSGALQVCEGCYAQLQRLPRHCQSCFRILPEGEQCGRCLRSPPALSMVQGCWQFNDVSRHIVLQAKFAASRPALAWMGAQLADCLPLDWAVEAIVPIPISVARLRQRGFNQTHFLASAIARQRHLPVLKGVLKKARRPAQSSLESYAARRRNLRGAFSLRSGLSLPKRIVLVDDVSTSGATLDLAAKVLREGGVEWIGGLVFAAVADKG